MTNVTLPQEVVDLLNQGQQGTIPSLLNLLTRAIKATNNPDAVKNALTLLSKQEDELIAALTAFDEAAQTPTPTPTPVDPSTLQILQGSEMMQVVDYPGAGFVKGINKETFELAIPAKYALRNYADVINTRTGRGVNIVAKAPYRIDGNVMLVNVGIALNPDTEGYPNYVFVRNREVPAQVPPAPPATTPTPGETVKTVDVSLSPDTSITGGDWNLGNWQASDVARQSFKINSATAEGQTATLGDGTTRKVIRVERFTSNMSVTYEGSKLDPAKIAGKPTVFKVPEGSVVTPTPTPAPEPTPGTLPVPEGEAYPRTKGLQMLNLGMGAGADHVTMPGIHGTNFTFATRDEVFDWAAKGFREYRIGFLMGRIYKKPNSLEMYRGTDVQDPTRKYTMEEILRVGEDCYDAKVGYMLDNHVYCYWPSNGAAGKVQWGSSSYTAQMIADHWYGILVEIKKNAKAWKALKRIDIVNEPYDLNAQQLNAIYKAVIKRCSAIMEHVIFVFEGPFYSSMSRWDELVGDAFDDLIDPRGPWAIEFSAHGYLDRGRDGYYDENNDGRINAMDDIMHAGDIAAGITWETLGLVRSDPFIKWCKAKKRNGNVGEHMVPGNLPNLLKASGIMQRNCLNNGINIYSFGAGKGFGTGNHHNIGLTAAQTGGAIDNTNYLKLVQSLM